MNVEYEDDREKPGPSNVESCLKCGTFYINHVEYIQHLLLHIERSNPVVYLNRKEVEDYFLKHHNSKKTNKMSDDGSSETNQMEDVEVDQKPIIANKVATVEPPATTELSSIEDDEDQMSLCSVVGDTASPSSAAIVKPEVNANSSVEDHKTIKIKSDLTEVNGQPPKAEEKAQSGSESDEKKEGPKSPAKPSTPNLPNIAISVRKSEDLMAQTNYNLIQEDLLGATNGNFPSSQKDLYRCPLCPQRFATAGELEAHSISEGHIICTLSDACAALNFDSPGSLAHHQALVHQAPQQTSAVQRLAAQVDRLPQPYQQYQPQYGGPPQQYNLPPPSAPYNGPKLGSQVMLTPVSSQPHPPPLQSSIPNLPAGIQVTKRSAAPPMDPSPNKLSRNDENVPNIRLPDSITLVKSQPAPSASNNVANMLATRGITMVASGSRQPSSPQSGATISAVSPQAKRLPNVPSAISIVPSRSQNQQRFAVPPAPQQRRNVTNLGTVDLTKDDLNGTARLRQRSPLMANALQRRFSCTICDKVYPSNESLQAHMAVHGQKGRFMCEICRVVYTNEAKLQQHKKTVHAKQPETEFVIPICDVNQPGVKEKLLQCGIRHVVQLSSLRNANDSAAFGLPIIPVDLARNEAFSRLDDMGASNILSLGTLRTIYR